jgi:hypothetical protein
MKVGVQNIDSTNFPNFALRKIENYYRKRGDEVIRQPILIDGWIDILYVSKIFNFTKNEMIYPQASEIIKGGTGYDIESKLPPEIENELPYVEDISFGFGFTTRGCIRNCSFCIVPRKEGKITEVDTAERLLQGKKSLTLLDNNILASEHGIKQLEWCAKNSVRLDCNQGLDISLAEYNIWLLNKIKWTPYIRFSIDNEQQVETLFEIERAIRASKIFVYCILLESKGFEYYESLAERINFYNCDKFGNYNNRIVLFFQPERKINEINQIPQWQKDLARWNNRFNYISFDQFKNPKKYNLI